MRRTKGKKTLKCLTRNLCSNHMKAASVNDFKRLYKIDNILNV